MPAESADCESFKLIFKESLGTLWNESVISCDGQSMKDWRILSNDDKLSTAFREYHIDSLVNRVKRRGEKRG